MRSASATRSSSARHSGPASTRPAPSTSSAASPAASGATLLPPRVAERSQGLQPAAELPRQGEELPIAQRYEAPEPGLHPLQEGPHVQHQVLPDAEFPRDPEPVPGLAHGDVQAPLRDDGGDPHALALGPLHRHGVPHLPELHQELQGQLGVRQPPLLVRRLLPLRQGGTPLPQQPQPLPLLTQVALRLHAPSVLGTEEVGPSAARPARSAPGPQGAHDGVHVQTVLRGLNLNAEPAVGLHRLGIRLQPLEVGVDRHDGGQAAQSPQQRVPGRLGELQPGSAHDLRHAEVTVLEARRPQPVGPVRGEGEGRRRVRVGEGRDPQLVPLPGVPHREARLVLEHLDPLPRAGADQERVSCQGEDRLGHVQEVFRAVEVARLADRRRDAVVLVRQAQDRVRLAVKAPQGDVPTLAPAPLLERLLHGRHGQGTDPALGDVPVDLPDQAPVRARPGTLR